MRFILITLLVIPLVASCGKPTADPTGPISPTAGQTWWAELAGLNMIEPEEAGGLLDLVAGDYPLLLSTIDVTDTGFGFLFALANTDATQDHCSRTIAMSDMALNTDGSFAFGPEDFTLPNGVTTEALEMTGQFSANLQSIESIVMKGTIQLNSIPEDLLPLGGVDVCELLGTIDINCGPCRDGSDRCLSMHMEGVHASLQDGVTLQAIEQADSFADCSTDTGGSP